jgi:hypothetical protein
VVSSVRTATALSSLLHANGVLCSAQHDPLLFSPATDDVMTMAPCPAAVSSMRGIWCFRHRNTPRAFTDITCRGQDQQENCQIW